MPAPVDDVHIEPRRVGELHQRDLVARDRADGLESVWSAKMWKLFEGESHRRMAGAPHHLPGIAVIADMASPGQRLEADPHAALLRALAKLVEIGRGAIDAAERVGGHIGADHHQVAAELGHQVELAFGASEGAAPLRLRHASKSRNGWKDDAEPERGDQAGDIARRAVERQQIAFEDLDADEARSGDASSFSASPPLSDYGCDRGLHRMPRWAPSLAKRGGGCGGIVQARRNLSTAVSGRGQPPTSAGKIPADRAAAKPSGLKPVALPLALPVRGTVLAWVCPQASHS